MTSADPPPPAAAVLFGERLALAERYAGLLATTAIDHGLVGPGETTRLWDRHLLNCAAIAPGLDEGASVVDVGSGAGLPGIALAIARPDLRLVLVDALQRRITWLLGTVEDLGLDNVEVRAGRAQSLHGELRVRHATARAVARLRVLAGWALPLLEAHGSLLALKGAAAQSELAEDREALRALGATSATVETYGAGLLAEPTRVVRVTVGDPVPVPRAQRGKAQRRARFQGRRHRSGRG